MQTKRQLLTKLEMNKRVIARASRGNVPAIRLVSKWLKEAERKNNKLIANSN